MQCRSIENGYALSTRRGFLGTLFSGLLALALFDPGTAVAQQAQPLKQIKLTEKQVQGFIAAAADMGKLYEGADPNKPDPKLDAQAGALAKKNGFASLAEYDDVSTNISMIMSGLDPQPRSSASRPSRSRMRSRRSRPTRPSRRQTGKRVWRKLEAALKTAKPIQFKENIALVTKYFDKLSPLMQG